MSVQPRFFGDRTTTVQDWTCVTCGQTTGSSHGSAPNVCGRCLLGAVLDPVELPSRFCDSEVACTPPGTNYLGPYALVSEIGRGGNGIIYRAVHRDSGDVVAVKTIHPHDAGCAETLTRFEREAEAAQSLDHPHSLPILQIGCTDEGVPYFSMKLALGGSLCQLGAKYRGRWRQIAELMVKICSAVQHAHNRGILHRDLKPGNILFDEDHEPFVSDFGLVRRLSESSDLTQSCAVLGTPNYVAPEQAAGRTRELTAAADIYSLGAVLFELLTGRPPFIGDSPSDVLRQAAESSPQRPRQISNSIPRGLDTICTRCLERRPEDRYISALGLATDLENWLHGRTVAPIPFRQRLQTFYRRHRASHAWFGSGMLVVMFALCAIRVGSSQKLVPVHMISIAIAVGTLGQDPALNELARKVSGELKNKLVEGNIFLVPDALPRRGQSVDESPDPLTQGRTANAQLVLAGNVRAFDGQFRLTTCLLRCDTGEIVWRRVDRFQADQSASDLPAAIRSIVDSLAARWHENSGSFSQSSTQPPPLEAQSFYAKAMELSGHNNSRDLDSAVDLLRRASDLDPHFAQARAMLAFGLMIQANSYGMTDRLPLAIAAAKEALIQDHNSAQAHRVIASCLAKDARYSEALEEFTTAIEFDPLSAGCYQSLGICLRELGQPGRAIPMLLRAVQLAPSRGAFSGSLGETLVLCGRTDEADQYLQRAVDLDTDHPESHLALSALRTWQQRFGEARQICADTRERFPDCRHGLSLAAWIEFCDGNMPQAKVYFEQLKAKNTYQADWECYGAINPASGLAHLARLTGSIEESRSLAQEALTMDQNILERHPWNPRILHDLAATYAVLGDSEMAEHFLNESISRGWVEHCSTRIDPRFTVLIGNRHFEDLLKTTFPKSY